MPSVRSCTYSRVTPGASSTTTKAVGVDVDHREIGVDPVDHPLPGERVGAVLDELGLAGLGACAG